MYDNTYLGMKSSDHHRSAKEAEAITWELAHANMPKKSRRASISRIYMSFIALLISAGIGFTALTSDLFQDGSSSQDAPTTAVETGGRSRGGSSGSDAFPWLNMIE